MTKQLLTLKQVCALLCRSKSSIYRDVKIGVLPAPIKTGRRAVAWIEGEIAEWQEQRAVLR